MELQENMIKITKPEIELVFEMPSQVLSIIKVFFCSLRQPRKTMLASQERVWKLWQGGAMVTGDEVTVCGTVDAAEAAEPSRHLLSRPRAIGTNLWPGSFRDLRSCEVTSRRASIWLHRYLRGQDLVRILIFFFFRFEYNQYVPTTY